VSWNLPSDERDENNESNESDENNKNNENNENNKNNESSENTGTGQKNILLANLTYRLNHKYMRRPRLMRMRKSLLYKNGLSSDIVSIALIYFLNSPHPSLKYGFQFFVIETIQNLLQRLKELILLSQLNPFESFFDCRKQAEVAGCQIR
jgi:hypothetical protein